MYRKKIMYFIVDLNFMYLFYVGGNSELSDKWKKEFLPEHCVSSVEVFDPATDTWSEGPELPNALCGAGQKKLRVPSVIRINFI